VEVLPVVGNPIFGRVELVLVVARGPIIGTVAVPLALKLTSSTEDSKLVVEVPLPGVVVVLVILPSVVAVLGDIFIN
jgi:hypothetical protein